MDTIFAVSSGAAPAAIAIIRLSGPKAFATAEILTGKALPAPRIAALRALRDPSDGSLLDRGLVLIFPGGRSATGEDLVELHVHGGRATLTAIENAVSAIPGMRRAAPGEFTRRALANGRIDLTEAEGLGDLLLAETEAQRRAALATTEGGLRSNIERWTDQIVRIAASIEAALDFSDEDDVPPDVANGIVVEILPVRQEIEGLLQAPPVERLKDGISVVIAGPPNAGKSTLVNAMADRDVAIVSAVAGTTRDRIEAPVVRAGIAYVLTDTAGMREAGDAIEKIGIERATAAAQDADILLWLGDDEAPYSNAIMLHPRADTAGRGSVPAGRLALSAVSGVGIQKLWSEIEIRARSLVAMPDGIALNRRQRELLAAAKHDLDGIESEKDLLLAAERLRRILVGFDMLTGRANVENVLDALFGTFCIGK